MIKMITDNEQARKKLFEKGGVDFAPGPYAVIFVCACIVGLLPASKVAKVLKKLGGGGGGAFFPS